MNYALNRLAIRLGLLGVAVSSGAVAVHQAQRGLDPLAQNEQQLAAASNEQLLPAPNLSQVQTANAQVPAPIPLQSHTDSNALNSAAPYSNEVVDYGSAADDAPYDDSLYASADAPAPYQANSAQVASPSYDLTADGSAGQGSEYETQYVADEQSQYVPVQPAQAQVASTDELPPPLEPEESAYPDVHDGTELTPPRPLPVIPAQAEELANNPFAVEEAAPSASDSAAAPSPLFDDEDDDAYAPSNGSGLVPPPSDDAYRGDATFQMPANDGSMRVADQGGRSHDDLFDGGSSEATRSSSGLDEPATIGNGQPGPEDLIGPQTPSLMIRKSAPTEAQVGKPTRLETVVRNVGKIPAHDVLIRDEVPRGTKLIDTTPAAGTTADGAILWQIGTIDPDGEVTVAMNVMPMEEGEIGSVATISFQVAATSRSIVTKPVLTLEHTGPQEILVGRDVVFQIRLTNTGTGVANNVYLEEDVPDGLKHFDGRELEFRIGTLKPGESRILELKLTADKPGIVRNTLIARGDSKLRVQDDFEFEVIAPDLQLEMDGPRKRFLDRKAQYQISIANPGTAPAQNVEMIAKLPPSLKYISSNNAGFYDPNRHAVIWSLEALPPKEMGTVELTVLPVQMGHFPLRVDAKANMNLADSVSYDIEIEGMAALLYTVTDVNDPIEVGGETTYEIQVINQGSKASTNLQLGAIVPSGMELIRGDGPARGTIEGSRIVFDPLPRLAPQADVSYRIFVRGVQPGDKRIQVKLKSDDLSEPVTKEESTHVYSDG